MVLTLWHIPATLMSVHCWCGIQVTTSVLHYPILCLYRFHMPPKFTLVCSIKMPWNPWVRSKCQKSSNSHIKCHHNIEETTVKTCHIQDTNWLSTTRFPQPASTRQHAASNTQVSVTLQLHRVLCDCKCYTHGPRVSLTVILWPVKSKQKSADHL